MDAKLAAEGTDITQTESHFSFTRLMTVDEFKALTIRFRDLSPIREAMDFQSEIFFVFIMPVRSIEIIRHTLHI